MVFRDGVGRATVIRSNPRGFREDADVLSRSGAREQDARGGVLVRFEERDAETKGRNGCSGVSWASWRTTVARGTHQLAGGLALALVRLEFILRELLVALQASQPLHGLRGVIGVARGLHGGSRQ